MRVQKQPGANAKESFDNHTLQLMRTTASESALKKPLSGIRILEKLRWIHKQAAPETGWL